MTTVVLLVVLDKVVGEVAFAAVEDAAIVADSSTEVGSRRPQSPLRSGSVESLIPWEELGSQGRAFVSGGPTADRIEQLTGRPATQPIRVYAGLPSGHTAAERAEVATAERDRSGAFERDDPILVLPTGTGWVDPLAVAPLEYLHGGRTAAAVIQYSYRPSWVQFLGNLSTGQVRCSGGTRGQHPEGTGAAPKPRIRVYELVSTWSG